MEALFITLTIVSSAYLALYAFAVYWHYRPENELMRRIGKTEWRGRGLLAASILWLIYAAVTLIVA